LIKTQEVLLKSLLKIAVICLAPSVAFAEPDLHRGGLSFGMSSVDGDDTLFGTGYSYDGDTTTFGGYYFVTENVSIGLAKTDGDLDYGATLDNFSCDVDGTSISASFHPKRTNYFTGEGNGYSFGIQSTDSDADCEDDYFYYNSISSDDQHVTFDASRGLGDGLVLTAGFASNTDDFLDDKLFSFGFSKMLDSNFAVSLGISIGETAEDSDGDNTEQTTLSFSGGYLF
jgi:hypothetical protein